MENLRNNIYKTGIQADTDIHNGGTIFGEIYRQVLSFDNNLKATLTNEIVLEKYTMDQWNIERKKRYYSGICKDNEKHIFVSFSNEVDNLVIDFYFKEIDNDMLLCESYIYKSDNPNYKKRESNVFILEK